MPKPPVAEFGAEYFRIVRHTHDVELATKLMGDKLLADGCPVYSLADARAGIQHTCGDPCRAEIRIGTPHLVWCRIVPALPGSFAESEGWRFAYMTDAKPGRGAFPAVVFS